MSIWEKWLGGMFGLILFAGTWIVIYLVFFKYIPFLIKNIDYLEKPDKYIAVIVTALNLWLWKIIKPMSDSIANESSDRGYWVSGYTGKFIRSATKWETGEWKPFWGTFGLVIFFNIGLSGISGILDHYLRGISFFKEHLSNSYSFWYVHSFLLLTFCFVSFILFRED